MALESNGGIGQVHGESVRIIILYNFFGSISKAHGKL
jgi:hypothetical protein